MCRPRIYDSPEELQEKIKEYFKNEVNDKNPPTIAGMSVYLGFSDRSSMYKYKERPEFLHTIKNAVSRIEAFAEKQLMNGKGGSGAIFWLKNHGWTDKQQVEHTNPPKLQIEIVESKDK